MAAPSVPSSPAPSLPATWTVLDVVKWTTARFVERGLGTPRLDAELLVAHVLALPRVQLYVQFERVLSPEELAALRELIKRRQAGESVAYLTGRKEFWKFEFAVDARVLVPRPDTETLIEEAIARLGEAGEGAAPRIADVGTGSGALAITLAKLRAGRGRVRERRVGARARGRARERRAAGRGGHVRRGRSGRAAGRRTRRCR